VKLLIISRSFKLKSLLFLGGFSCLITLSLLTATTAFCAHQTERTPLPRIVTIDPGHGGRDAGAHGSDNLLEKQVAMKFSAALAEQLRGRYKVLLTRTGDYNVPLEDRIAKSNHARADVFISIHTGASLLHNLNGISIFYYEKPPVAELKAASSPPEESRQLEPWDVVKPEQIEQSKYLAELIKKRLLENQIHGKLTVAGVPLFISVGTEMPTIMIEVGFITNPGDAQRLNNDEKLQAFVRIIAEAVDDFFSDKLRL